MTRKVWTGQDRTLQQKDMSWYLRITKSHQCLSREHLQQGDEVVSIPEVFVQVGDMSLGLRAQGRRHSSLVYIKDAVTL